MDVTNAKKKLKIKKLKAQDLIDDGFSRAFYGTFKRDYHISKASKIETVVFNIFWTTFFSRLQKQEKMTEN